MSRSTRSTPQAPMSKRSTQLSRSLAISFGFCEPAIRCPRTSASASSASRAWASQVSPRASFIACFPASRHPHRLPSPHRLLMNDASTPIENGGSGAPSRASGSSFYTAMRILPRAQREAMFEIYSFCRLVDDVADSTAPHAERSLGIAEWRSRSAVGRLSVRVFGVGEQDGIALAHHLGRALQLTNILRDVDEDAEIGRLYLPAEELQKAGIASTDPKTVLASPSLWQPCQAVAARALEHFKEADRIMARNPRRVVKAPKIMEEVYRVMLNGMTSRGWSPPRTRVSVSPLRLS